MTTLEQWRKQLQNTRGIFQNFRSSYERQIYTIFSKFKLLEAEKLFICHWTVS